MDYPSLISLEAGDSDAWRQLSDILAPKIRFALQAKLKTTTHAEIQELESAVFFWLLEQIKINKFKNIQHLEARAVLKAGWMAVDFIRKVEGRRDPAIDKEGEDPQTFGIWFKRWFESRKTQEEPAIDAAPLEEIIQNELAEVLLNILASLKEDQRMILKMIYIEDMTHQEVADKLGIPRNTVSVYCSRLLTQIRNQIDKQPHLAEDFKLRYDRIKLLPELLMLLLLLR